MRSLTDELVRRAEDGSTEVVAALNDAGRWLGIALASTFNVLDLQAVVLGGCFGPLSPWLVDEVRRTLEERSLAARSGSFVVVPSAFGTAPPCAARRPSLRRALEAPGRDTVQEPTPLKIPGSVPGRAGRGKEVAIGHP